MAITTNGKVSITNLQVGSSADLASIISDESGTGVLAFTTSPTFTTPNLGTPSAVTLTNGTGLPVSGITASTSAALGVGTIELGHATDTTISRASAGVVAIEGVNVVTETATQTLTNKTLTSPVISSITNTGTLTLPTTTGTVALTSDITVTDSSTNTLSNKSISLTTNTVSGTTAEFNTALSDGDFATLAGSETLTNKTLTTPTINTAILKSPEERMNIVASAATGTINFDVTTSTIWYYTSNASANHTLNFRFSSGATLNDNLTTGDAITVVWLNTNGATPYYPNVIQVDGVTVTPKFQNGTSFSAGNASSIDAYSFTIIKTASATFTVLASQTKFA